MGGGTKNVVVTFQPLPGMREAIVEELSPNEVVFLVDRPREDRLTSLQRADAVLGWTVSHELEQEEIDTLEHVGVLQLMSAGADHLPFDRIPPGVIIASNVGAYADPMAEHAVGMILALAKRLPQKHAAMARGEFPQLPATKRLRGAVCAILGFGGIGKATGRLLRPLGMRIHVVNTSGRTEEPVEWVGTLDDLDVVRTPAGTTGVRRGDRCMVGGAGLRPPERPGVASQLGDRSGHRSGGGSSCRSEHRSVPARGAPAGSRSPDGIRRNKLRLSGDSQPG